MREAISAKFGALVLASLLVAGGVWAQEADSVDIETLREQYRIDTESDQFAAFRISNRAIFPGSTINTPTAFGARLGQVYGGISYQQRTRYSDRQDAIFAAGAGFGNARKWIGLDLTLTSLDTYSDLGEDWSLSVKIHRSLPRRSAVAIGYENIWHTDGTDGGSSAYGVFSKIFQLRAKSTAIFSLMSASVGIGNDRFLPEDAFRRNEKGINVFGNLGVRLHPSLNAIANWTGQDLGIGISISPFPQFPVIITPALMDVLGTAGDGARFSVGIALLHDFRR